MRLINILIGIAFLTFAINISAQSSEKYYPNPSHPEWFKAIPLVDSSTPEWAVVMYTEDDNFEKVERLKKEYYKVNEWKKNIHIQNYKHWLKAVQDHVADNGKVNITPANDIFLEHELEKKNSPTNSNRSNTWINIGPANTLNSDGSQRPTQANVFCLGVAPSDPSTVYAGMETGGIFKSIDKGLTWNPSSWDYAIGSPEEIKVDPLDHNTVYVIDGTIMYKTIDGGSTWVSQWTASDV